MGWRRAPPEDVSLDGNREKQQGPPLPRPLLPRRRGGKTAHRSGGGYKDAACYHHQGKRVGQSARWNHPAARGNRKSEIRNKSELPGMGQ